MARIELQHLSKVYHGPRGASIRAVHDLNLTVGHGELLALVGPSACGKTTTLRLIAGLEESTAGAIALDGEPATGTPAKDRDIAMVFQSPALLPHLTARDNLALGLKLRKFPAPEIRRRVAEAADWLGIATCLDRLPKALSGGERQRVALGRALVRQPRAFLFDEPLSNLDAALRHQMGAEIKALHARLGATMICVTHDQAEAMTLGDRIAVMRDGVLQQVAEPPALYQHPANLFVAGFIGSPPMNLVRGVLANDAGAMWFQAEPAAGPAGGQFRLTLNEAQAARLAPLAGRAVVLGLRPEEISLAPGASTAPEPPGAAALIESVEVLGPETLVRLRTGPHRLTARLSGPAEVKAGEAHCVEFASGHARFFDPETEAALA